MSSTYNGTTGYSTPKPLYLGTGNIFKTRVKGAFEASNSYYLGNAQTESSGTTPTLTVAQVGPGAPLLTFSGQTAAVTATLPTAVLLAGAWRTYFKRQPNVGDGYCIKLRNNNTSSGTVTVAVGTGVTASPAFPAQAIATVATLWIYFTGNTSGSETCTAFLEN